MSLGKLFKHARNYSLSSLTILAASLISYPILTRLLEVGEYGLLSLISIVIGLVVALAKAGMQNSIVRFYAQAKQGKGEWTLNDFYTTVFLGIGLLAGTTTLLWATAVYLIPTHWWDNDILRSLFLLSAILVLLRVMDSAFSGLLRAMERSGILSLFHVARRYLSLLAVVVTLFFISRSLFGFYTATILAEASMLVLMAIFVLRRVRLRGGHFSLPLFKSMLAFGLPLVGHELAWTLFNLGDRLLIQYFLGPEPLGIYSAAYNLCDYLRLAIVASLWQAMPPMYTRIWEEKGREETIAFVSRSYHFYILLAFPVIAGMIAIGPDVLTLLASQRYAEGGIIIPWVVTGMILNGMTIFFGAGFFIAKKTRRFMSITLVSTVLNISLNLYLIPRHGIQGAAIATLASFFFFTITASILARRILPIPTPILVVTRALLISVAMYLLLVLPPWPGGMVWLTIKIPVGALFYVVAIYASDSEARGMVRRFLPRARPAGP